jgi:transcriptional regulator with XRE-family HTH domain
MSRGGAIRERRIGLGLSQRQVGAMARVAQSEVSRAELDKPVGDRVYKLIEDALGSDERDGQAAWMESEQARIAGHQEVWDAVPESPEKDALKAAMLARAFDLLCEGRAEEADTMMEFLPQADVLAVLQLWETEVLYPLPKTPEPDASASTSTTTAATDE